MNITRRNIAAVGLTGLFLLGTGAAASAATASPAAAKGASSPGRPVLDSIDCGSQQNPIKIYNYSGGLDYCLGGDLGTFDVVGSGITTFESGDYGGILGYDTPEECYTVNFTPYNTYSLPINDSNVVVTTTEQS
jgi:hypothetical protein